MGNEILYCSVCGSKLLSTDFTRGRAHTVDKRSFCSDCLSKPLSAPPTTPKKPRTSRAETHKSSSAVGIVGLLVLAVVAVGGVVWFLRPASPPAGRPTAAPGVDPKEIAARKAIAAAEAYARTHPLDLPGQAARWRDATRAAEGTSLEAESRRHSDRTEELAREASRRERARLEEELRAHLEREEFGAALEAVEKAKRKAAGPEDALALDGRAAAIRTQAKELLPGVLKEAVAAARGVDRAPVKTLRDRIARWGLPDLAGEVERALATRYYRLPSEWKGTGLGKVLGNPVRMEGGGAWTVYQVWPDDPLKAEHYVPMGWSGKLWMANSNAHVSAPGAHIAGSDAEMHYRGAWDNPAGYKIPALAFLAPDLGTYVLEAECDLDVWEGGPPAVVKLLKLDRSAKTVHVLAEIRLAAEGAKTPLRGEARLDRNQELALTVQATTYHVAGCVRIRGLTVHRRAD
ncbi:MAG TPA: hypothetical protein VEJ18_06475 [Planctomycetota bacterium]|nr:hypothetical protein [Planctomycetota bacterium]